MPNSANPPAKQNCETYEEQRDKIIGTINEGDLYMLFKIRFREIFKEQTRGFTFSEEEFEVIARDVWNQLPLSPLQSLVRHYRAQMSELETLATSNSANPQPQQRDDSYEEQRKKMTGSLNEEELFNFFKIRFREAFQQQAPKATVSDEELEVLAKHAWAVLPISTLRALVENYKIHLAKQETIKKANKALKEGAKKCDATNCNGKCSICRKNNGEGNVTKANGDCKKENNKNCKDGKKARKDFGKRDKKKDPRKCEKKMGGNGKCKDSISGENKRCGDCAQDNDCPRCKKDAEERRMDQEQDGEGREDAGTGCRDVKKRSRSQSGASVRGKKKRRASKSSSSSSSSGSSC